MVKAIGSPAVRTMLDVKSMCSERTPIPDLVRLAGPYAAHVHANDANRRGPGFGEVDFVPIFRALDEVGYEGYVSVEVFDYSPSPEVIARGSLRYMREAQAAVASVLGLVKGKTALAAPAGRARPFAPKEARAFWLELAHPAAGGFAGELWPNLVEAAMELFPAPAMKGKRQTIAPGSEQRLAWIETSATALGVAGLTGLISGFVPAWRAARMDPVDALRSE